MATGSKAKQIAKADKPPKAADGGYAVLTPLNHDGENYEPGDSIELTGKDADPLLSVGAIEKIDAA